MPRPKTVLQNQFPYHVTGRCINKEWFKLPMGVVWEILSNQLWFVSNAFEAQIHSFVLMSNHYHLLISTPRCNIDKIMAHFGREATRFLNEETGRINQAWGGPYFRCLIKDYHYFMHAYKYVYLNPVKARLSKRCEDYPYSSLNFLLGGGRATFPVVEDLTLFSDLYGTLGWLNRSPDSEAWRIVERALELSTFRIPKRIVNGSPNLHKELL